MKIAILFSLLNLPWWVLWLVPFILGVLLGWALWSKWKSKYEQVIDESNRLRAESLTAESNHQQILQKNHALQSDCDRLKQELRKKDLLIEELNQNVQSSLSENTQINADQWKSKYDRIASDYQRLQQELVGSKAEQQESQQEISELRKVIAQYRDPARHQMEAGIADDNNKRDARIIEEHHKVASTKNQSDTSRYEVITPDDLEIVDGIGEKMKGVLNEYGIKTIGQLSTTTYTELKSMLKNYGSTYKHKDPISWPDQARLAVAGEWEKLNALQQMIAGSDDTKLSRFLKKQG